MVRHRSISRLTMSDICTGEDGAGSLSRILGHRSDDLAEQVDNVGRCTGCGREAQSRADLEAFNTAETGGISGIEAHGCALVTASARGRPS